MVVLLLLRWPLAVIISSFTGERASERTPPRPKQQQRRQQQHTRTGAHKFFPRSGQCALIKWNRQFSRSGPKLGGVGTKLPLSLLSLGFVFFFFFFSSSQQKLSLHFSLFSSLPLHVRRRLLLFVRGSLWTLKFQLWSGVARAVSLK